MNYKQQYTHRVYGNKTFIDCTQEEKEFWRTYHDMVMGLKHGIEVLKDKPDCKSAVMWLTKELMKCELEAIVRQS